MPDKKKNEKVVVGGKTYFTQKPKNLGKSTRNQRKVTKATYGSAAKARKVDVGERRVSKTKVVGTKVTPSSKERGAGAGVKKKTMIELGATTKSPAAGNIKKRDIKKAAKSVGAEGKTARDIAKSLVKTKKKVYRTTYTAPKSYKGKGMKQYSKKKK